MVDHELIGSSETCDILRINRSTLIRWVRDGRLPVETKLPGANGAYLFRRYDVERLHSERSREVAS